MKSPHKFLILLVSILFLQVSLWAEVPQDVWSEPLNKGWDERLGDFIQIKSPCLENIEKLESYSVLQGNYILVNEKALVKAPNIEIFELILNYLSTTVKSGKKEVDLQEATSTPVIYLFADCPDLPN